MRVGLFLYRSITKLLTPFAGMVLQRRVRRGKESPRRLNERVAKQLAARPDGPLIWFHAASVGESLIQVALAQAILKQGYSANLLFTCQTLTGADVINESLSNDSTLTDVWTLQQMAPLDLPQSARRFVEHWRPDLTVFAEGDIWPNLLGELEKRNIPSVLTNARMTDKSLTGWSQWPKTAKTVFGYLDLILASDKQTAMGIESLIGHSVPCPGNLKSALPQLKVAESELQDLRGTLAGRAVFVAASTHQGEEALFIDAIMQMTPKPFAIIAPRHPERGDQVEALLECSNLKICRRSREDALTADTDVLLADTMGEMGLWYRLADIVYLGGGHSPGVGGHNPLEPIRLGKTVLTGPSLFNFSDITKNLVELKGLIIVNSVAEIVGNFSAPAPPKSLLDNLNDNALEPMNATVEALRPFLDSMQAPR